MGKTGESFREQFCMIAAVAAAAAAPGIGRNDIIFAYL